MSTHAERDAARNVASIARVIDRDLPELARRVIDARLDLSRPENTAFLASPDDRRHHQMQWHQWGIITHTRVFLRHFDEDMSGYLRDWNLAAGVNAVLDSTVDDASRRDLLRVSILLHDIGKFGARTIGRSGYHFPRHEEVSGDIIREELDLPSYGLTAAQTEYIATTAQDHFVLGLMRKAARETGVYDAQFVESDAFEETVREIERTHPDDRVEIGVLFLCDSLAKSDPAAGPARAVSQYTVNTAVSRRYLELVDGNKQQC